MAERKRAIQLKFYVTEQERILIEEKMKLLQTDNLGAYLRKMAIDCKSQYKNVGLGQYKNVGFP
uniref:plasmid mobilization protein n=1 Tax=Catenibacterium mitsuokai TaxID=100886 RepID=UPI003A521589